MKTIPVPLDALTLSYVVQSLETAIEAEEAEAPACDGVWLREARETLSYFERAQENLAEVIEENGQVQNIPKPIRRACNGICNGCAEWTFIFPGLEIEGRHYCSKQCQVRHQNLILQAKASGK